MIFLLRQALPLLVLPFGISLISIVSGLLLRRRAWVWTGVVILWLSSLSVVSGSLMRAAEGRAERLPGASAPSADAIVVLSTGRIVAPGHDAISEWREPDRFFGGIELFQAGKAPLLVFTGGWSPWAPTAPLEGDVLATYAKALGVPGDRIITTGRVLNTGEEASAVTVLLRERLATRPHILLVTSAYHIPRAQRLFERAGLAVTPFPVDFAGSRGSLNVMDLLPTADALEETQRAMREVYGRLFYLMFPPTAAPDRPAPSPVR